MVSRFQTNKYLNIIRTPDLKYQTLGKTKFLFVLSYPRKQQTTTLHGWTGTWTYLLSPPLSHPDRAHSFLLYIPYYFVLQFDNIPSALWLVREHESYSHKEKSMGFAEHLCSNPHPSWTCCGASSHKPFGGSTDCRATVEPPGKLQPHVTGPRAPHPRQGPARPVQDTKC